MLLFLILCSQTCSMANADASEVVLEKELPSSFLSQVKVSLLQTDHTCTVRTVIQTRMHQFIKNRITKNERANWQENYEASKYLQELEVSFQAYSKDWESTDFLQIDFISSLQGGEIKIFLNDNLLSSWSPSSYYLQKNQEYIILDIFDEDAVKVLKNCRLNLKPQENEL